MNLLLAERLQSTIVGAGVAITSLSIGTIGIAASVSVRPANLQAAAQATINAFDWSDAATSAWRQARNDTDEPDLATLRDQATQAVADINTFLAIANPSNAQIVSEVKAIDVRQRGIIKALGRLAVRALS